MENLIRSHAAHSLKFERRWKRPMSVKENKQTNIRQRKTRLKNEEIVNRGRKKDTVSDLK